MTLAATRTAPDLLKAEARRIATERGVSTNFGETTLEVLTEGDSAVFGLQRAIRKTLERASEPCPELVPALGGVLAGIGDLESRQALGSFASDRWQLTSGAILHEILVSGRHLSSDADEVAHTLIHELAHLLAHVRGFRDCSNRGRYHNRRFKDCAEELGLIVERGDRYGYFTKGLSRRLREHLAPELQGLRKAMTIRLNASAIDAPIDETTVITAEPHAVQRKYVSAICKCTPPRVIRVAVGHWIDETIGCFLCRSFFFDPEGGSAHTSQRQRQGTLGAIAVSGTSAPVIPDVDRSGSHG